MQGPAGRVKLLLAAVVAIVALTACGGGGGGSQQGASGQAVSAVLSWSPPSTFNDNTALDPYLDLEYF